MSPASAAPAESLSLLPPPPPGQVLFCNPFSGHFLCRENYISRSATCWQCRKVTLSHRGYKKKFLSSNHVVGACVRLATVSASTSLRGCVRCCVRMCVCMCVRERERARFSVCLPERIELINEYVYDRLYSCLLAPRPMIQPAQRQGQEITTVYISGSDLRSYFSLACPPRSRDYLLPCPPYSSTSKRLNSFSCHCFRFPQYQLFLS